MQTETDNPNVNSENSEQGPTGGTGTRPPTNEMIDRFKRFYGFRFDTDMARKLELSDGSAIGNWRRRDSIDLLLIADYCPEINLDWLIWGRGTRTPPPAEDRTNLPDNVLYLQEMGVPSTQIITIVNEALEKYLGGNRKGAEGSEAEQTETDGETTQEESATGGETGSDPENGGDEAAAADPATEE